MKPFGRKVDREAFLNEAMPHIQGIYRMALKMTGNPALAEDLVQETYKEAWKSFHLYEIGSNCRAWLFKIFFRLTARYNRTQRRFHQVEIEKIPDSHLSVQPAAEDLIETKAVLKVLDTLPEHYRVILVLADVEELTYREIADILRIPIGTVMSRLNRARTFFRQKLSHPTEESESA